MANRIPTNRVGRVPAAEGAGSWNPIAMVACDPRWQHIALLRELCLVEEDTPPPHADARASALTDGATRV